MKLYDFVKPKMSEEANEMFNKALKKAKVKQGEIIEKAKEENETTQ